VKIAFDIGGVLSKYPDLFRPLVVQLQAAGVQVFVITDVPDRSEVLEMLRLNDFAMIPEANVYSADYATHGETCKAVLLREQGIDMFFDDFIGYVAVDGCPVRCLVMPDATRPYYHETWKTVGTSWDFGRAYTRRRGDVRDR